MGIILERDLLDLEMGKSFLGKSVGVDIDIARIGVNKVVGWQELQ